MEEIKLDQENLRFLQSYIRKFNNKDQYEESLILNIKNGDDIITYKNDDLIIFLQDKKPIENDYICDITLLKEYKYGFNYYDENITVTVNISKDTQHLNYNSIFNINWNDIRESITLKSDEKFIKDIQYVFYFKNPDIENYCRKNEHIYETISLQNDNDIHDKLLNKFKKNRNIDIKVFQIDNKNFDEINKHINEYIINVKVDGIRTLIVIANNIIKCYQGDYKFIYNYTGPTIEETYIFDSELCNGNLHIFDCWYYSPDNNTKFDVCKYPFISNNGNDRITVINNFIEKYNFIKYNYVYKNNIPIIKSSTDYRQYCKYIKKFIENKSIDNIITLKRSGFTNENFTDKYYENLLSYNDETLPINKEINEFNKALYDMYKENPGNKAEAYNICKQFNIDSDIMFAYSPYIILGLIYYYYLIDFKDDEIIYKNYVYSNKFLDITNNKLDEAITPLISNLYKDFEYPKDGLIFVKNTPINFSEKASSIYYKWKPKDKLSFDVKIEFDKDDIINIYEAKENYVLATFLNNKNNNIENSRIKIELNNFNRTLPCCKNGDIVLTGDIVEIVPYYNNFTIDYILLRIRYDKVKANGERTIKTIKNCQSNYINLIL